MACGSNKAWYLFLSVQFYWNTTIPVHVCIVHSCFYVTTAEMNSCDRDLMTQKPPDVFPCCFQKTSAHLCSRLLRSFWNYSWLFHWSIIPLSLSLSQLQIYLYWSCSQKYLGLGQVKSQGTNAKECLHGWQSLPLTGHTHLKKYEYTTWGHHPVFICQLCHVTVKCFSN